jgi:hypothetical protein
MGGAKRMGHPTPLQGRDRGITFKTMSHDDNKRTRIHIEDLNAVKPAGRIAVLCGRDKRYWLELTHTQDPTKANCGKCKRIAKQLAKERRLVAFIQQFNPEFAT